MTTWKPNYKYNVLVHSLVFYTLKFISNFTSNIFVYTYEYVVCTIIKYAFPAIKKYDESGK